ncbi:RNA polymerase sigma factor [Nocardiopsis terrae]
MSWEYLLKNELPRIAAFLQMSGATPEEAKECAQEALAECWARRTDIQNMNAYLRKVAHRVFLKRPVRTVPLEEAHTDPPDHAPSPCAQAEDNEGNAKILAVLGELPPAQRTAMAYTLDGYDPAEIAVAIQSTPQAVRTSLNRARNTLKTRLTHLGKDCT